MTVRTILLAVVAVIAIILGAFIYAGGIFLAATFGFFPSWLVAFLPIVGQIYLVFLIWQVTEALVNLYTIALVIFVCLLVLCAMIVLSNKSTA